jgi:hypothetical protein
MRYAGLATMLAIAAIALGVFGAAIMVHNLGNMHAWGMK